MEDAASDSIQGLYRSFLVHAKNRQGMPNTIGDLDRLGDLLLGFSPVDVIANYGNHTDILDAIVKRKIPLAGRISPGNARSHWVVYTKSALASAHFLSRFSSADSFHAFVETFYFNEHSRLVLPLLLKDEVFGFGFALACDLLKESGYGEFIKPDTHIQEICRAAGITNATTDSRVFKDVVRYCTENGLVPYEFDKLLWLVGSGNFYLHDVRFPARKSTFISNWLRRDA